MSLFSILNGSGVTGSGSSGSQATLAAAKLAAKIGTAATAAGSAAPPAASTSAATGSAVISAAAKAAAAAKADNAKDFAALSKEVRQTLDSQYAAGRPAGSPDLTAMSGRALAAIALNRAGAFSASEAAAAKAVLHDRARSQFTGAIASGGGVAALAAYSRQVVSDYDGMSSEERQARGWTGSFRASNATFVDKASSPILFDQLD